MSKAKRENNAREIKKIIYSIFKMLYINIDNDGRDAKECSQDVICI